MIFNAAIGLVFLRQATRELFGRPGRSSFAQQAVEH
jgi:hypothetical protein